MLIFVGGMFGFLLGILVLFMWVGVAMVFDVPAPDGDVGPGILILLSGAGVLGAVVLWILLEVGILK